MNHQRILITSAVLIGIIGTLFFLAGPSLMAQTDPGARYVTSNGNDTGGCSNPLGRCITTRRTANVAAPGDQILVATGVPEFGIDKITPMLEGLRLSRGLTDYDEGWQSYPIYAGEMTSIAIAADPAITQTVYVGTRDAGVFKTTNGGLSWQPARTGLTFYPIRSLEVDPKNSNVLYAGTDYDGIWKSADGGNTWSYSSNGLDTSLIVFNIVIDPQNTDILYAGLAGNIALTSGNVYKSENGGTTWVPKDSGIPHYYETSPHTDGIISLAIDPTNPLLLYAGTNHYGAFRSTNGGETWSEINEGLPLQSGTTDIYETVNALATDPHNANRLSAIVGGEYYIFDGSWQKISQGIYNPNSALFTDYLYFHPISSTVIYSAGDHFSKSKDEGVNWTWFLGWNISSHVPDVTFHPASPDTLYAATDILFQYDGGVYKSSDQGETWTASSQGVTAAVIRSVAIDPQDADRIYAGGGNGHFYRTQDGGATWKHGYTGGSDVSDVAVDPVNPQNVYAADGLELLQSFDYGETFSRTNAVEDAHCIAATVQTSTVIYVGTGFGNGIYKSSDGGTTWEQKNQGLPPTSVGVCPILSLTIDPNDTETVWAGTRYGGGIVKSTDGGEHWQAAQGVYLNDGTGRFAPHPISPTFGFGWSFDIAMGDVDGDGDLDAITANYYNQAQAIYLNDGTGRFASHPISPTFGAGHSHSVALGDLDGDGDLDAVVANYYNNQAEEVYLNDGTGRFIAHPDSPTFGAGRSSTVALGDLDGDGDLDAIVSNIEGQAEDVYLNDGTGCFAVHRTFGSGRSTDVVLGDMDGDGDLDALVANFNASQTVWLNRDFVVYLPLVTRD